MTTNGRRGVKELKASFSGTDSGKPCRRKLETENEGTNRIYKSNHHEFDGWMNYIYRHHYLKTEW